MTIYEVIEKLLNVDQSLPIYIESRGEGGLVPSVVRVEVQSNGETLVWFQEE